MTFPSNVLIEDETWRLAQPVRTSGQSLAGQEQLIVMPATVWAASFSLIIPNPAVQAWRHWLIRHRGGLFPDLIGPTFFRAESLQYYETELGFDDGYDFGDGTSFVDSLDTPAPITLVGAHSAGATSLSLRRVAKRPLTEADWSVATYIGLASRFYQVTGITIDDDFEATLSIWPPLRAAAADEAPLDATPRTRMRLVDPNAGWVPDRTIGAVSRIRLEMVEDLSSATVMS